MNGRDLEAFLARLYTDPALRTAFLAAPESVAREAGLGADAVHALSHMDREGLLLAADSFSLKRATHAGKRRNASLLERARRAGRQVLTACRLRR